MDKNILEKIKKEKISKELHIAGVLTVVANLVSDLEELLEEEGRYHGTPVKYVNELEKIFRTIFLDADKISIYNEVKYLYKPLLSVEFNFLKKRKVTSADCVIIILQRLLEQLETYEWCEWRDQLKNCKDIVYNFYNNIRNPAKNSKLIYLISNMVSLVDMGASGKRELDYVTLQKKDIDDVPLVDNTKYEETTEISEIEL